MTKLTNEMKEFIKEHYKGKLATDLTDLLNEKFESKVSVNTVRGYKRANKLRSGVDMRFGYGQKMHRPPKGVSHPNWIPTQFKKGNKPHNTLPIGTEIKRIDGYVWIKCNDLPGQERKVNRWRQRSHLVWEKHNKPIEKDEILLHLDGDRTNDAIENLHVIKKSELAILNKQGLIYEDPDATKVGILIAKLSNKTYRRNKDNGSTKHSSRSS